MILKSWKRGAISGWHYIDGIERIETHGPVVGADGETTPFHDLIELFDWAKSYFGDDYQADIAFQIWPEFESELGGQPSAFTVVAVRLWLTGGRLALAFLGQDEAYLLSDAGHTVDRLR